MESKFDIKDMDAELQRIKSAAENLTGMGENFPALSRNLVRILASVKMLELNISDYVDLQPVD